MRALRVWGMLASLWLTLACAGVSENVFEWSTGAEMEEKEDGQVSIEMPNGDRMITKVEEPLPEDFPIPPPPWEAPLASTITHTLKPNGNEDITVTFQPVKRPREEVMAYYQRWMKGQKGRVKEDERRPLPGFVIHSLVLEHGGVSIVTIIEGYGFSNLSLVYSTSLGDDDDVESKKARSSD